jgi:hypothetical protein
VYTCPGGYDAPAFEGKTMHLDMAARRRLLARGLSFHPDAVIANGDHIYWHMKTTRNKPLSQFMQEKTWAKFGAPLDLSRPTLHPKNAETFLGMCDYQIAGLYGTMLRSTPAFFLAEEHDMLESDELDALVAPPPADSYGALAAEQTQHLYYPEFLPDPNRPLWLPGGDKAGLPADTNMAFGTLRYGTLLETVFYDCQRYVNHMKSHAKILPRWVENWLLERTYAEDTTHFLHAPSMAFAYSSGKPGDWYPDLLDERAGRFVLYKEKAGWQRGWFAQHQRLLEGIAAQKRRTPAILQGHFHATAAGRMLRSGDLRLERPVEIVMSGTLGTGDLPFPSSIRGAETKPSPLIGVEEALKPTEKNGFTLVDVTADELTFTQFMWRPPQLLEEIDTMKPALVYTLPRKS